MSTTPTNENNLLTEEKKLTKAEQTAVLQSRLWAVADLLRGQMNSSEYANYMLGIIFYKYLSESLESDLLEKFENEFKNYEEVWAEVDEIEADIVEEYGYSIKPEHLFRNIVAEINKGTSGKWSTDLLHTAFNNLEESPKDPMAIDAFSGLFDDLDLNSTKLGKGIPERNKKMADVIKEIAKINFHLKDSSIDILGDAYEYLIANFASEAGKKGGEFYTPQQVSYLVSQILSYENPSLKTAYDPTCGSGSLLLQILHSAKRKRDRNSITLYGQEMNTTTYNLARMNMIMHGQRWDSFHIKNDNTLTNDEFTNVSFDAIGANPPYSAKWVHTSELSNDDRFVAAGKLAPKDKADFAFVQHCWHHLNDDGVAAIVLPHGVLFRGGAEGVIREWLLRQNAVHAVIGLPANLFFGTTIPTVILVLKKGREADDGVLFIDASEKFKKGKNQNHLEDAHLEEIMNTYKERKEVEKFAHIADIDEIDENESNLNITRYVDISGDEVIIDLEEVEKKLLENESKLGAISEKIQEMISQLVPVDEIPVIRMEKKSKKKIEDKSEAKDEEGNSLF